MIKYGRLSIYILGGFLFLLDQVLKYLARTNPQITYIWKQSFGWEYFANTGVAFNIPLPNSLVILLTPLIIFGLSALLIQNKKILTVQKKLGLILIIAGAISNFIDRILFNVTIDYLRIFTTVINLADVMIVIGVILLLLKNPKSKTVSKKLKS